MSKNNNVVWRHSFLRKFRLNDSLPAYKRKRNVYTDERCTHLHYNRFGKSLCDPDDDEDNPIRMQYKGQRFCFVSAIRGSVDWTLSTTLRVLFQAVRGFSARKEEVRLVVAIATKLSTEIIICIGRKTQLLPNLSEPSIIFIDNAKNH